MITEIAGRIDRILQVSITIATEDGNGTGSLVIPAGTNYLVRAIEAIVTDNAGQIPDGITTRRDAIRLRMKGNNKNDLTDDTGVEITNLVRFNRAINAAPILLKDGQTVTFTATHELPGNGTANFAVPIGVQLDLLCEEISAADYERLKPAQ